MDLKEFIKVLEQLDASEYGQMISSDNTDEQYYDAQREKAGLMDWTSNYGTVKDNNTLVDDKSVRDTDAWKVRKHLAKIVIDGIRFDKDHLDELRFADNDHMRELGGLVATYYKRNQLMHRFAINSIFYDYFRDWTKGDFDNSKFIDETYSYDMATKEYGVNSNKFTNDSIKKRRSEFIRFWADHFGGKQGEDNRATYNWEPSDEDLQYWIEKTWFDYFENNPKRFERVTDMLIKSLENNSDLRARFREALLK